MNAMTTAETIYELAKTLPEEQAREALDFIEFLQAKLRKLTAITQNTTAADDALPGFGMWANRPDMPSTEDYLRTSRKPRHTL